MSAGYKVLFMSNCMLIRAELSELELIAVLECVSYTNIPWFAEQDWVDGAFFDFGGEEVFGSDSDFVIVSLSALGGCEIRIISVCDGWWDWEEAIALPGNCGYLEVTTARSFLYFSRMVLSFSSVAMI